MSAHTESRPAAFAGAPAAATPRTGAWSAFAASVRADHRVIAHYKAKYSGAGVVSPMVAVDALRKIGFQMMIAYRLMRLARTLRIPLLPAILSRLSRHAYAADIHFDADFEPGVMIVHGMGLCISHGARVGQGCILFQGVTLGEGIDPQTRVVGSPWIERDVHVGPGATLIGPITIGARSKVMAGCVVTASVPPDSIVEAPVPVVRPRSAP